ncbi:MAG TPA: hypothetical protein PLV87_08355 [Opitutaceae bacterium]|nr:hypothetical protein [Opitutaceae bacterium]
MPWSPAFERAPTASLTARRIRGLPARSLGKVIAAWVTAIFQSRLTASFSAAA